MGLTSVGDQYARLALITHPGSLPGAAWALWISGWCVPLVYPRGAAALVLLMLPDGAAFAALAPGGGHRVVVRLLTTVPFGTLGSSISRMSRSRDRPRARAAVLPLAQARGTVRVAGGWVPFLHARR